MTAKAAATDALNLGQGFPDSDGPVEIIDAAVEAMRSGANQYPPVMGTPELRHAVAEHRLRFWGHELDPDAEVLATAGATEAIAASMLGLCEVGDDVVVFDPTYDCYAAAIAMAGARIRPVPLRPPDPDGTGPSTYWFDRDELRRAFSDRTRLIIVNTPHNPTGKVFTDEELAYIAELCVEFDVLAVTDEVYEHLVFDPAPAGPCHRVLAMYPGMAERTVSISSGGKTFSFTGWKIGWAMGPAPLLAAVRSAKQFLTFVNGAPLQPAIATGLRLGDDYFDGFRQEHQGKRDRFAADLRRAGFGVHHAEGTYFLTADITPLGETDGVAFCLDLPERAGVVAVPSAVFYQDRRNGASLIRFCFAKSDETLREAGERLATLAN